MQVVHENDSADEVSTKRGSCGHWSVVAWLFAIGGLVYWGESPAHGAPSSRTIPMEVPQPVDSRLEIMLYADAAEIVTPIGAAVDARGRLFVLESHTHRAPRDYKGPKSDRVKMFEGSAHGGRAAKVNVFADGLLEAMNLAFAPDGTLYVSAAKTVAALPDRDGDERCDGAEVVLRFETRQRSNPHNQILGLTFSPDGWLYVSRGNNAGFPYAWVGSDGRRLEGYGDGGDIVRCRPDGSGLERVATGFWNPFDLKFDRHGRLLCVDNDPDSRGPNRLVHVVMGGDYGFKSRYGASGLHPYNAWEGELPGTLPMVAGIGESPSGVLDLSYGALPSEYDGAIATTIWLEHEISLVRLRSSGASIRGTVEPFIRGGRYFRPVAMAAAPDGTIYITDWVLKDYPNHGQGRIWKLVARERVHTSKPPSAFADPAPDAGGARINQLLSAGLERLQELRHALKADDPFIRHAATVALARPEFRGVMTGEFLASDDPALRLGALLALRRADISEPEPLLRRLLVDPDETVRQMAMIWTGENELRSLLPEVESAASLSKLPQSLFEIWLATLQLLQNEAPPAGAQPVPGFKIKRPPNPDLLDRILTDETRPPALRAHALRHLSGTDTARHRALLIELARSDDVSLRLEAIRTLTHSSSDAAVRETLRAIAADRDDSPRVRAEAIVALGAGAADVIRPLLDDPERAVRTQAARTLRLEPTKESMRSGPPPAADDADAWIRLAASGGDREAGERVFFSLTSTCAQCHRVDGRGGTVGPDLSLIPRTVNREQLIRSIILPSENISPEFQGWEIQTKSGEVLTGLQGHWRGEGATLLMSDGRTVSVAPGQVVSLRPMDGSLMPEGLAALFSVEEFRDLVAFLTSLK